MKIFSIVYPNYPNLIYVKSWTKNWIYLPIEMWNLKTHPLVTRACAWLPLLSGACGDSRWKVFILFQIGKYSQYARDCLIYLILRRPDEIISADEDIAIYLIR